jgi:hypothetical protein
LTRRAFVLAALAALACRGSDAQERFLPLPKHGERVRLRVAYFHQARLPGPDATFRREVLARAVPLARTHLGIDLHFGPEVRRDLDEAFAGRIVLPQDWRKLVWQPGGRRDWLVRSMLQELKTSGTSLEQMAAYARPHLVRPAELGTLEQLADALIATQLARFDAWRPLLGEGEAHQFLAWLDAAGQLSWPYEVVLTNQLIASVEYGPTSLHSALRGGVTNGITTQSEASAHGLVSVLSLFPFTSNEPAIVALRGGARAEGLEPAQWAAALLVHELGHQLLHLSHPYGRPACVMNAPPLLDFRAWVAGLDAKACPVGSSPEMRPGVLRFRAP